MKKLDEYKFNTTNPFLEETAYHVEKGEKVILMGNRDNDLMVDKEGNVKAHSVFAKRVKIDKAQFAKIYIGSLQSWFDLSKPSIRIFTYIIENLKPNKDYFMFDYEECMEHTKYKSKQSIVTGMRELMENKFIARGKKRYLYYINPTIFFNGDRFTFLKQYELKENDSRVAPKSINEPS